MKRFAFAALLVCGLFVAIAWPQTSPTPPVPPVAPAAPAAPAASGGLFSQVPPEAWSGIVLTLLMVASAVAHQKGYTIPVLSDLLKNATTPPSNTPAPSPTPEPHPGPAPVPIQPSLGHGLLLQMIQQAVAAELKNLMTPAPAAPSPAPPATPAAAA